MSKCVTMYEENKPSTLINDTRWGGHFFRAILVRSAMPNIIITYYYILHIIIRSYILPSYYFIRHSRIYTIRKMFDCKKCPVHLVSFIKHHGLFVPYIVHIFDCEKCPVHLVSFIKHHGLFVPYIVDIFIFLIRTSWLSPSYIHPFQEF
jgi:hypothetical protein